MKPATALSRPLRTLVCLCAWSLGASAQASNGPPDYYPTGYRELVEAARREGAVNILGTTDRPAAEPLMRAFEAAYPGIKVSYSDLNTKELDQRYRKEAAEAPVSDIVWSSAMDTQIKLVQDGLAAAYESPEARRLPSWAEYQRQAYAVTYEPVVFAYNRNKLPEAEAPQTHAALAELLESKRWRGKVVMLHPGKSALAMMLAAQDALADPNHARVWRALGVSETRLPFNNAAMLKELAAGDAVLGFNMLGSYAEVHARSHPQLGYVIPRDYALVVSRVALIAKRAPHPNAARLWLDFVLSAKGQTVLANESGLGSVRDDVDGPFTLRRLRQVPGLLLRPIGVSARLLDQLEPGAREAFVARWVKESGLEAK